MRSPAAADGTDLWSHWDDPLLIRDEFTPDERRARDEARAFAEAELAPGVVEANRHERYDNSLMRAMGACGLLASTIPEAYGGSNAGYVAYGLIARELERVDSAYRSAMSVQASLVMYPIRAYGSEAQRRRYLPRLARGEIVGCFGLTEPDAGSDPAAMRAHARQVDGGYRLTGAKIWITSSPIADLLVVWAKSEAHGGRIRGFLLERGMEGLATPKIEGKFAFRAWPTGEIVMDEVFVPEANLLPGVEGLKGPFGCLNFGRYAIAWGALGAAEACWHAAREHALAAERVRPDGSAGQLGQRKLADMQTEIAVGLQAVLRLGRLAEAGRATPEMFSLCKRNAAGKALDIARSARDVLGPAGTTDRSPAIRHMLNLEAVNTYEGTHDIHALLLGRAQTGLQAFA